MLKTFRKSYIQSLRSFVKDRLCHLIVCYSLARFGTAYKNGDFFVFFFYQAKQLDSIKFLK